MAIRSGFSSFMDLINDGEDISIHDDPWIQDWDIANILMILSHKISGGFSLDSAIIEKTNLLKHTEKLLKYFYDL